MTMPKQGVFGFRYRNTIAVGDVLVCSDADGTMTPQAGNGLLGELLVESGAFLFDDTTGDVLYEG